MYVCMYIFRPGGHRPRKSPNGAQDACVDMVEFFVVCGEVPVEGSRCQQMVQGCTWERQLWRAACSRHEIESLVLFRSGG
ncbi:hypothetical protein HZ326_28940 [Fusarium oxysporum f. sp. albedinis]|nr:hypothetical protein HZ326_28940 [Fusarium oxysporum f. sp. albedinis]